MSKVAQIIEPSFRTGETNGKPWVLSKIRTDDGKEATAFAPINVGDEVEVEHNEKYNNYSAKKVTAQSKNNSEIIQKLDRILELLGSDKQDKQPASDLPPAEVYDDIPF